MEILIDQERCVGGGQCVFAAEDVFDQRDEDGVAFLVTETIPEDAGDRVRLAAQLCPAQAIHVSTDA